MRTIIEETTLYQFDELTPEAQEKAINHLWDINVDYEWWDCMYGDASGVGLKITGFDLDRNRHATGDWIESPERAAELILQEHGEQCETYQTAIQYLDDRKALVRKYSDGVNIDRVTENNEYEFDQECDNIDAEFLRSLLNDYAWMLQREYEYLTSEEAIKETILCNEYEFTPEGDLY